MRKNIFDLLDKNNCIEKEVKRIKFVFEKEYVLYYHYSNYTIKDFVDEYCFADWEARGHCIDVKDYLETLNYFELCETAEGNVEDFITFIEIIYNLWNLTLIWLNGKDSNVKWQGNYWHLKELMDDVLAKYNYKMYIFEAQNRCIAIEDKPEVTSLVEIMKPEFAVDIIKYNHYSLKGEIELKKTILISLGAELEPRRKELQKINNQLSDDIFFMLNNINIRHNNRSKKDIPKYKEYVANMTKKQLEKWYDELYQMILLAFLLLDNVGRTQKLKQLKDKIVKQ